MTTLPSTILPARHGLTMVEMAISSSLFGLMIAAMFGMISVSQTVFDVGTTYSHIENQTRRISDILSDAVQQSGSSTFLPTPLGGSDLTFNQCQGYSAGAIVWGNDMTFRLEYDQNELDNGIDDDFDGLVDEGRVVMVIDDGLPTEQEVVLTNAVTEYLEGEVANGIDDNGNGLVDERGLSFNLTGEVLTIRLTLQALDDTGQLAISTIETAVQIRNDYTP